MTTTRRGFPRATRLNDGRVLVTGGELVNNGDILDSAEIYDPSTNMFIATGTMTVRRDGHTSTLLPNGQVLIAGGHSGPHDSPVGRDTAELYNPGTGLFIPIATLMTSVRVDHAATLLANNQVLLAGGSGGVGLATILNSAELYDPLTNIFLPTANMHDARSGFDLVLLQ